MTQRVEMRLTTLCNDGWGPVRPRVAFLFGASLNQACVEYLVGNLADVHVCTIGYDTRVSCCRGANETNYFMLIRVGPSALLGPLSLSIQFMYLDQACVEDFICYLLTDIPVRFDIDTRVRLMSG